MMFGNDREDTGHLLWRFGRSDVKSSVWLIIADLGVFALLFISGICVWPYIFSDVIDQGLSRTLLWMGAVDLVVSMVNCVMHVYLNRKYRILDVLLSALIWETLINWIVMAFKGVQFIQTGGNLWIGVLAITFSALMGAVISVTPAILGTFASFLVKTVIFLRRKR